MVKQSYVSGTGDIPLIGVTIGEKFDEIVNNYSDREALIVVHQNIRWTYQQLSDEVVKCAKALMACGLQKGDRLGIWAPNQSEWTILQFATAKAGIILVNINPSYRKQEVQYALNQSGCKMIVLADQFKTSDYTGMISDLAPELKTSTSGQLNATDLPELRMAVVLSDSPADGFLSWKDLINKASEVSDEQLQARQDLSLIHI